MRLGHRTKVSFQTCTHFIPRLLRAILVDSAAIIRPCVEFAREFVRAIMWGFPIESLVHTLLSMEALRTTINDLTSVEDRLELDVRSTGGRCRIVRLEVDPRSTGFRSRIERRSMRDRPQVDV